LYSSLSTAWKRASINMSIATFAMRPPTLAREGRITPGLFLL
jgi:hypothetical protein